MKKRTYLLDTLKDNEVVSTIVLKNKKAWELDWEKKFNEILDAFKSGEINNFDVINYNPFYKITFRKWVKFHGYVEYTYLYRFEERK